MTFASSSRVPDSQAVVGAGVMVMLRQMPVVALSNALPNAGRCSARAFADVIAAYSENIEKDIEREKRQADEPDKMEEDEVDPVPCITRAHFEEACSPRRLCTPRSLCRPFLLILSGCWSPKRAVPGS